MLPRPGGPARWRGQQPGRSPHPLSESMVPGGDGDPGSVIGHDSEAYDGLDQLTAAQARAGAGNRQRAIPKVVDQTAEMVGQRFEDFLDT